MCHRPHHSTALYALRLFPSRIAYVTKTMNSAQPRKNRTRHTPAPSGRPIAITDNDIYGIFEPLSRHAQLTTKQLLAYDRRYAMKTRARLTKLFHDEREWIGRLGQDVKFANYLSVDEMYRIEADSALLLISRGIIPNEEWVLASRIGGNSATPSRIIRLAHDHMASDIAIDIEIGARADPSARFINHIEIIRSAPPATQALRFPLRFPVPDIAGAPKWIEPDALFGLGNRYYAIEADMNTESISQIIRAKILAYREIVSSCIIDEHLGIDNLTVLFLTTSEQRMRAIMEELRSIARDGRSKMFAFAYRPDLANFLQAPAPTGELYRHTWERVGNEPLQLNAT